MPLSDSSDIYPGISGLDDLELFHQGLISKELLALPQRPARYVDAEGAPVASLSATGDLQWLQSRSARPFERWHTAVATVASPIAVVDHPDKPLELPTNIATLVVLASAETSRADLHLIRTYKQRAETAGVQMVVLPLGFASTQRRKKLAQLLQVLQTRGVVLDFTTPDLLRLELDNAGLVVFFTGLSGSGKSTLARELTHHLIEDRGLEVTLLDGDVVRRRLSRGLTFSTADRNANVQRVGWVAAEIARHGGIAVVSLIAPFDIVRREVKEMVSERGGHFMLVHVATPVEECERRDRKGLYAKARAGLIPDFTGVTSPYEPPLDADLHLDTTLMEVTAATEIIIDELTTRGWLEPFPGSSDLSVG